MLWVQVMSMLEKNCRQVLLSVALCQSWAIVIRCLVEQRASACTMVGEMCDSITSDIYHTRCNRINSVDRSHTNVCVRGCLWVTCSESKILACSVTYMLQSNQWRQSIQISDSVSEEQRFSLRSVHTSSYRVNGGNWAKCGVWIVSERRNPISDIRPALEIVRDYVDSKSLSLRSK